MPGGGRGQGDKGWVGRGGGGLGVVGSGGWCGPGVMGVHGGGEQGVMAMMS